MSSSKPGTGIPLSLTLVWWLSMTGNVVAAGVLMATVPAWHSLRVQLAQLGVWQCWASVLACVALLLLSRQRKSEQEQPWAQGALLIFVLGGLLSAVVLNYGVLGQWLLQPASWLYRVQTTGLLALHWALASLSLRHVLRYRRSS